jgi:membrane protein required for colicin V production
VLLLFALYILAGVVLPHSEAWPPVLKDSRAVPYLYQGAAWMVSFLPETYRPKLAEPVQPPPTISADLLHVSPEGRALGPRPERN